MHVGGARVDVSLMETLPSVFCAISTSNPVLSSKTPPLARERHRQPLKSWKSRRDSRLPGCNKAVLCLISSRSFDDPNRRTSHTSIRQDPIIDDYANLQGPSLLKRTLGLQNHRHARYIGLSSEYDATLLDLRLYDDAKGESPAGRGSFRKVGDSLFFHQFADADSPNHAQEIEDLDTIEKLVAPHGEALIKLYFRIVHPSFPILHKKVYLEKYSRNHREFSPPLLAAVYALALNWWSYSTELSSHPRPDVTKLEEIAFRTLQSVALRPKLSTVQAGLLLLQRPQSGYSWMLTAQLVAMGQDLGLHMDPSTWRIPSWERGLRKRLAWALYCQDTWSALVYGRPPHIGPNNWSVPTVTGSDFPESAADEDEEDGSTEVEKGRTLFSAMISLSQLLSDVLDSLYSEDARLWIRSASDPTKATLDKAKPIQLRLRSWFATLPDSLRMDATRVGKLNSTGYLHLAYFATEITLHRRLIQSLSSNTDPYLTQVIRSAAKARLISAMDFFNRLRPEHLQSFWYFASKVNFALIGTFNALLWATSVSAEEADFYQRRLQEYRWTLRVSNKSAEFLEIASGILESAVGSLLKAADNGESRLSNPKYPPTFDDDITIDTFLGQAGEENGYYEMSMDTSDLT
jgi:hypothetical protein